MQHLTKMQNVANIYYRPERGLYPVCHRVLKRDHILWHKCVTFSTGVKRHASEQRRIKRMVSELTRSGYQVSLAA